MLTCKTIHNISVLLSTHSKTFFRSCEYCMFWGPGLWFVLTGSSENESRCIIQPTVSIAKAIHCNELNFRLNRNYEKYYVNRILRE